MQSSLTRNIGRLSARSASKHDIPVKRKIHAVIECHWITISEIMAPYFPTVSFEKWVLANTGAKWTPRSCLPVFCYLNYVSRERNRGYLFLPRHHAFRIRRRRPTNPAVESLLRLFRPRCFFVRPLAKNSEPTIRSGSIEKLTSFNPGERNGAWYFKFMKSTRLS